MPFWKYPFVPFPSCQRCLTVYRMFPGHFCPSLQADELSMDKSLTSGPIPWKRKKKGKRKKAYLQLVLICDLDIQMWFSSVEYVICLAFGVTCMFCIFKLKPIELGDDFLRKISSFSLFFLSGGGLPDPRQWVELAKEKARLRVSTCVTLWSKLF